MVLNDDQIRNRIETQHMIVPAYLKQIKTRLIPTTEDDREIKTISAGVSSFGYDIMLGSDFKIFTNVNGTIIDPKHFNEDCFVKKTVVWPETLIIPPNGFVLAVSAEWWKIPRDIVVVILGKSTYARCGLIINCTPLEPEWEGNITLELTNSTPLPMIVYPGEGIAQAMFHVNPAGCSTSYKDKAGKYQNQEGLTLPKV